VNSRATDIKPKIIHKIDLMYHINITQYILVTMTTRKWHIWPVTGKCHEASLTRQPLLVCMAISKGSRGRKLTFYSCTWNFQIYMKIHLLTFLSSTAAVS